MTVKGETCQYGTELCFGTFVGVPNLVPIRFEFTLEDFDKAGSGDVVLVEEFKEIEIVVLFFEGIAEKSFLFFDVLIAFHGFFTAAFVGCTVS